MFREAAPILWVVPPSTHPHNYVSVATLPFRDYLITSVNARGESSAISAPLIQDALSPTSKGMDQFPVVSAIPTLCLLLFRSTSGASANKNFILLVGSARKYAGTVSTWVLLSVTMVISSMVMGVHQNAQFRSTTDVQKAAQLIHRSASM